MDESIPDDCVFAIYPHRVDFCGSSESGLELFRWTIQDEMVTDESPPPAPDQLALQGAAREVAYKAMADLESKAYSRGFHDGWEACNERWRQMLSEATQQTPIAGLAGSDGATSSSNERVFVGNVRPERKASDVVLSIIKERPGLRGVQIVRAASQSGEPTHERTVRTALHRMKRDGLIKNLDGRWFTADAGPTQLTVDWGENDP